MTLLRIEAPIHRREPTLAYWMHLVGAQMNEAGEANIVAVNSVRDPALLEHQSVLISKQKQVS